MIKQLTVLDERHVWHEPMIAAARARGYDAKRITRGHEALQREGLGFIRPHANPNCLLTNIQGDWPAMDSRLTMVQDYAQVELYDNKSGQFARWAEFMPPTWRFTDKDAALAFVNSYDGMLVGKADVGASSHNVYILKTREMQQSYVKRLFGPGIRVTHSSGGGGDQNVLSIQRGYCLLQTFIPHEFTMRVNRIGDYYAIFLRFNGKDGKAQTGNVRPVKDGTDAAVDVLELLRYAEGITNKIGTRWVALDILKTQDGFKLIETSLAWPWPSPGDCDNAMFFHRVGDWADSAYRWRDMWELMLDEYERGVFNEKK